MQHSPGEGSVAVSTAVLAVTRMKLHVAVSASFMFEQALTELTVEWHLVAMYLEKSNKETSA